MNKHKHILHLDSELTKVIDPSNIFPSYRGAKTLRDLLIHSKLPVLGEEITKETRIIGGCQPCKKNCVLCKNYLIKTDCAYSHQTETRFKIKSVIDCLTRNVIYLINDNICKISSVGYTADNMKTRFANHKSHIKFNKRLCEVSKHIKSRANILTRVQSKAYTEPSSFSSLFNLPYSKDIHYFSQARHIAHSTTQCRKLYLYYFKL